jgi:cell division protein ZapA
MPQVTVTINGRAYRMACDEGEQDRLVGLARRFDGAIATLRESFGEIGDQRLEVMAGILVTDQLSEAERRLAGLGAELEALRQARASVDTRSEELEDDVARRLDAAAERIEALARDLNRTARDGASG